MNRERDLLGNPLRRLLGSNEPKGSTVTETFVLRKEQRQAFPHVIYSLESNSPFDMVLIQASCETMSKWSAAYPVVADFDDSEGEKRIIVRMSEAGSKIRPIMGAVLIGLSEATRHIVDMLPDDRIQNLTGYKTEASNTSAQLLNDLVSNAELSESFGKYYCGLRWGSDQEKFIRDLFVHSVSFDPALVEQNLTGRFLNDLTYTLNLNIPYQVRDQWRDLPATEILAEYPELDYRRLEDESFKESSEGQKLAKAYTQKCGETIALQYSRSFEGNISPDGKALPQPQIPLTKFPVIEALMASEVSVDRVKGKNDFGPSGLSDLIIDSDSKLAHQALVAAVNHRFSAEQRKQVSNMFYEGPKEFEHKHRVITTLIRAYQESYEDESSRPQLRDDLLAIIDAYTGKGVIAESVRVEYEASEPNYKRYMREPDEVVEIITDLLASALTAPDPELVGMAEELIETYLPEDGEQIVLADEQTDLLAPDRTDLMIMLVDSLNDVSSATQPAVFEKVGNKVFGSMEVGAQLKGIVNDLIESKKSRRTPEVLKAILGLRGFSISIKKDNPDKKEARRKFDELTKPSDKLYESAIQKTNQLLINTLNQIANSGTLLDGNGAMFRLFKGLVGRVKFNDHDKRTLPAKYDALKTLANHPGVTDRQKGDILWQMYEEFKYVDQESTYLLLPVILDMLQISLGSPDNVRLPNSETGHQLGAIERLVSEHGRNMFKAATQDQLQEIANYARGIIGRANQIGLGAMLTDRSSRHEVGEDLEEWQKETLKNISYSLHQLKNMEKHYLQYLRIEAVKVYPHIYYPWLLEKLTPFWQKMQWEVGPGNQPKPEIRALYGVLQDHVKNRLVIRKPEEYAEDFDVIGEGHVDTLIKECYERMVVPHDIKYNTTVWRDGLTFMHLAVAYMPEELLEELKEKYQGTGFAEYLNRESERRKDEPNIR